MAKSTAAFENREKVSRYQQVVVLKEYSIKDVSRLITVTEFLVLLSSFWLPFSVILKTEGGTQQIMLTFAQLLPKNNQRF